jgi:predicted ATP-dependent endonuclease of OLD family
MLGMGASTLAFFPTRDAVISEGPTELIMLGTLLRETIGQEELGFQIVPGSATARPSQIGGLDLHAPQIAWLVDGDQGGRDLARKIAGQGVPQERIVAIGGDPNSGLVVEDLVAPAVYVQALNEEIGRRSAAEVPEIAESDIGGTNRPARVKTWCEAHEIPEPDKIAVAHHIVEMRSTRALVDPNRVAVVRQVHADLQAAISRTG